MLPMNIFMIGSLQLIQLIQLFNWFSKRRIVSVLGFSLAFQLLGLASRFLFTGTWSEFPDEELAALSGGAHFFRKTAIVCFLIGTLFLCMAVFDYFQFTYHPLQRNVMINVSESNLQRKSFLEKMETVNQVAHGFETQILKEETDNIYTFVDH